MDAHTISSEPLTTQDRISAERNINESHSTHPRLFAYRGGSCAVALPVERAENQRYLSIVRDPMTIDTLPSRPESLQGLPCEFGRSIPKARTLNPHERLSFL